MSGAVAETVKQKICLPAMYFSLHGVQQRRFYLGRKIGIFEIELNKT
jgi:hypothetical protein